MEADDVLDAPAGSSPARMVSAAMDDDYPFANPGSPLSSAQRLERTIAILESGLVRIALADIRKRHGTEPAEQMKRRLLNAALAAVS